MLVQFTGFRFSLIHVRMRVYISMPFDDVRSSM